MEMVLLGAFFALLACLAWINFRLGAGFLILLLPAYLIRFNFGPLPSTLLELSFGAIFLVWLLKYALVDWMEIKITAAQNKTLFVFIGLFFAASLISVLANPIPLKALGIWRAYFLEPMLLFFVLIGRQKQLRPKELIWWLGFSTLAISVLAIGQKLTGQFYPPSLWDDQLFGRATAFFTTPNAIGLYIAPLIFFFLALKADKKDELTNSSVILLIALSLLAIMFSFSQGAWVALGAGAIIFVWLVGYKKIAAAVAIIGVVAAFALPPIRSAVLFQDQAGQNRLTLWRYTTDYLTASPTNFFIGAGLRRFFTEVQKPYYNVEEMERLIYPHNIFLNFWTETGLLGAMAFSGILICLFYLGYKTMKKDRLFGAAIIGALTVFVVHGLVDVPYFKNDLAMLFWIIVALIILAERKKENA